MAGDRDPYLVEINTRLIAVEQKLHDLPTREQWEQFATKKDLEPLATKAESASKADLEGLATKAESASKADLEGLATKAESASKADLEELATKAESATKADLERFATKEDLERFATKEDLARYATLEDMRREHAETRRHFEVVIERHRDEIRQVAEGHMRLTDTDEELNAKIARLAGRVEHHDLRLLRAEERLGIDPAPRR